MLSVVVPAFNEADSIQEVLSQLCLTLEASIDVIGPDWEVVVVSDGSTDATVEKAEAFGDSRVVVLELPTNVGKGAALRTGFESSTGEIVVFFDGDLDIDPAGIVNLISILQTAPFDVVVGSKVHPNSIVSYPTYRRIQSHIFRMLTRATFRLSIHDTQTGLKVFRRVALESHIYQVEETGFAFDLELLARINQNYRIGEGPIRLDYQFQSSVGLRVPIAMLYSMLRISKRMRRDVV